MSCVQATKTITAIYNQPEIDECISKLVRKEHRQDFKQEVFLILLEVPCEKIVEMNGTFKYYVVRIILNLVRQKRNIFHKTYLDKTIEYNTDKLAYETSNPAETDTIAERAEREQAEDETILRLQRIDKELGNNSYPFHARLLELVAELGNMRRAALETGIPETTVKRTVKKIRKQFLQ